MAFVNEIKGKLLGSLNGCEIIVLQFFFLLPNMHKVFLLVVTIKNLGRLFLKSLDEFHVPISIRKHE